MLYADEQQNVLITTAVQGAIISQDRYPHDISASCAQYLIESAQAIHQWETDQAISPLFNYTERIHKYEGYGWFSGPMATKLLSDLSILVVLLGAFAHGDFLVSNCIINEQGITMIDWELTRSYLPGYDLALLWTCFEESPHARQVIDSAITSLGSQSWHMACAIEINRMLIVARELKEHALLPSSGKQSRRMSLLQRDFAYVWKRIEGMQW